MTDDFLIMGARDEFGSPHFTRGMGEFWHTDSHFPLPEKIEITFEPLDENSDISRALQNALEMARTGAQELHKLAPLLLENGLGNVDEWLWRALRELIPEPNAHRLNPRYGAEHVVYEAARTQKFARFLATARENRDAQEPFLRAAGELMVQSHFSLDHRWKIRSEVADQKVKWARETPGFYGARLTFCEGRAGVVFLRIKSG